jgi:hypothetical protein
MFSRNAFKKFGAVLGTFFVLLACIPALSGCGRAKAQARYDGAAEKKQNNAGTLSVILPLDIAEIEQKNAAASGETVAVSGGETVAAAGGTGAVPGEAGAAAGEPIHKLAVIPRGKGEGIVEIKEKIFISQTNDVYLNPEDYMGKTIKLEGLFKTQAAYGDGPTYCFVLRYGPGCCGYDGNAGFEVAWDGEAAPYPSEDDWVEAVGVLQSYEEDGYPYLYLSLTSLRVLDQRGAEFVTQ